MSGQCGKTEKKRTQVPCFCGNSGNSRSIGFSVSSVFRLGCVCVFFSFFLWERCPWTTTSTGRKKQFQSAGPVSSSIALVSYGLHATTTAYCMQHLPWTASFPGYLKLITLGTWPAMCFARAILQPLSQDAHGAYLLGSGFMPALLILVGSF